MKSEKAKRQTIPFWSWNGKLDYSRLETQIEWMKEKGFGGFFMHARSGLETEYLSDEWFDLIKKCALKAKELGMEAWAYDENGWPSGFVGGKLLSDESTKENYLEVAYGESDDNALVSYDLSTEGLVRLKDGNKSSNAMNVYKRTSVSTVDILDDGVVEKFINETHEKYNEIFDGKISEYISGFFTDEPQYYCKAIPFPHLISKFFADEYNIDVLDELGLLFCEKEGFRSFRYKYYHACQHLFLNNYSKKIYDWCTDHNVKLTGHYIEEAGIPQQMYFCGGIMPFYEYEHIPGIDWLCRRFMTIVPIKQLVSVCAQLGKKEVLTESFAMTGWDVTPTELRAIAEFQYTYGINMMCTHLLPYSELGYRKNDYPTHFYLTNAWANEAMGKFNEYFDMFGELIRNSEEEVSVAVLHPMRSAYLDYGSRNNFCNQLNVCFLRESEMLARENIAFHYIDETIFEKHGFVDGNELVCGKCRYKYFVILSDTKTMGKTMESALRNYSNNGGKVLMLGEKPKYIEGDESDYSYLESNTSFNEIKEQQKYRISVSGGKVRSVMRKNDEFEFIHVLNIDGLNSAECKIEIDADLSEYDFVATKVFTCGKSFNLKPYESKTFLVNRKADTKKSEIKTIQLPVSNYEVEEFSDNYLVLDCARFSCDGKEYSENYPIPAIFENLIKRKYKGDLWLKFEFDSNYVSEDMRLMYENCQNADIWLNGNKVIFDEKSIMDEDMLLGKISEFVKVGMNQIVEKLYFYENDDVFPILYGGGMTASLKNKLVYDTYLESLRIVGHFGVYGKNGFNNTDLPNFYSADSFFIGKPKKIVNDLLFDGFTFFAGKIRLKNKIYLSGTNVSLKITGRIHYAKLFINGNYAGDYLFNDELNVSDYAIKGENIIEIELYTGSRNLFGPFHEKGKTESFYAAPSSFSMAGSWKEDFTSSKYSPSYTFVRTGIFEYDGQFRVEIDY